MSPLPTRLRRRPRAEVPPSAPPVEVASKAVALRRLELDVTRRLDGLLGGDYRSSQMGPGSEPAGARECGPGDDARHIDWNLTARSLAPQVRTTEADRELETWVVADRSPSMDFGTAEREKREVVLAAVAAFGFLTVRAGNRLGVVVAGGDGLQRLEPRAGRSALLAALVKVYDSPRREARPPAGADIAAALARMARVPTRRSQIVVVSDFLDTTDWVAPLRRLASRHQVIAVQVVDPRELELPAVGLLSVVDTETGRRLDVGTSPQLRARYAAAATERQARLRAALLGAGAEHLLLSTERDWLVDVARFVRARRAGVSRRGAHPAGSHLRPAPVGTALR